MAGSKALPLRGLSCHLYLYACGGDVYTVAVLPVL